MGSYRVALIWMLRLLGVMALVVGVIMFVQTTSLTLSGIAPSAWDIWTSAFTLVSVLVTSALPLATAEVLSLIHTRNSQNFGN